MKPWRKSWTSEEGTFRTLPLRARALFRELLILADDDGVIECGQRAHHEHVCWALGADRGDRRMVRDMLPALLADGCVVADGTRLTFPNWDVYQADDAERQVRAKRRRPRTDRAATAQRSDHEATTTVQRSDHDRATKVDLSARNHGVESAREEKIREDKSVSATHLHSARARLGSSIDCPDPLGEHPSVSSAELPWRAWLAASRRRGMRPTDADRRAELKHLEPLERRLLELAPIVAEARGISPGEAAELVMSAAVGRYAAAYDAERAPDAKGRPRLEWRLGWVVSRWAELTAGAVPPEVSP